MTDPYERLNDEIHSGPVPVPEGIEVIAFGPFAPIDLAPINGTDDEFAPGGIVPRPTWQSPTDETEYYFPPGCLCYIKDDIDWGEHYVRPPGGCPVHHHNLSEINQLPPLDGS